MQQVWIREKEKSLLVEIDIIEKELKAKKNMKKINLEKRQRQSIDSARNMYESAIRDF